MVACSRAWLRRILDKSSTMGILLFEWIIGHTSPYLIKIIHEGGTEGFWDWNTFRQAIVDWS
jgi:hypothetical protein